MNLATALSYFFAAVWVGNGLFCKVLGWVPRHRTIVARILGETHADLITRTIGFAEICMAAWILSGITPRINAVTQIAVIAAMNILEFFLARDLLLWGRLNAVFASILILLIYYREFFL
ncbi:MAG: DoxX-like family protein [Acidobacteriota bacterium]